MLASLLQLLLIPLRGISNNCNKLELPPHPRHPCLWMSQAPIMGHSSGRLSPLCNEGSCGTKLKFKKMLVFLNFC